MRIFKKNKMFLLFQTNELFLGSIFGIYFLTNFNYMRKLIINNSLKKNLYFFLFKNYLKLFQKLVKNIWSNLQFGCYIEILVIGIGYKCWRTPFDNLILNFGHSHYIEYKNDFKIFFRITKATIKCFSYNLVKLGLMVAELISLRPRDNYKGKGLGLKTKSVILKVGKQR